MQVVSGNFLISAPLRKFKLPLYFPFPSGYDTLLREILGVTLMQIVMKYLPGNPQILENKMRHIMYLPTFLKKIVVIKCQPCLILYITETHIVSIILSYLQFHLRKLTFASSVSKYLVLLRQLMTRIRVWCVMGVGWGAFIGWSVVKLTPQLMVWCNIHVKTLYKHCFSSYLINSLQCRLCSYRQSYRLLTYTLNVRIICI